MTKKKLVKLLENIPDDYEVLVDTKRLRTVFADHENQQVNLSSDAVFQYAFAYNPLDWLTCVVNSTNKQCANLS